ncbi:Sec-independent protein translocase subunit TatA [Pseudonocardia sp. RS11V-5]|uniref:Sec-independent protein translocase subunit TatA n=1 Tax=Pseudonocardia terrae TaxID=2905831 RepID=UPI001E591391|nr:Sec-independent protein translocase subunit TatA [Pseudonocardia terrae]MCE3554801.1 Sec-independent protein translocase subunit TatA [Pseudonocardia terrae]
MSNLGGWEIVILVGVLLLLFGAKRLPSMARSVGQSARIFKGEMRGLREDAPAPTVNAQPPTPTAALPVVAEADAGRAAEADADRAENQVV